MQVKHDDFLAATKPLLELIGQDAVGLYIPATLEEGEFPVLSRLTVLRAEDPQDGTEPVVLGDDPEFQVNAWPLVVEVVA